MNRKLPSFIVCGLEHSGTTLISDIFREIPGCDSGFECGVLLCNSPREFPRRDPFFKNMLKGWMISEEKLLYSCETDSFDVFYARLYEASNLFKDGTPRLVFDKTPRYIINLEEICKLTGVPVIAAIKDPRSIAASDFKRSRVDIGNIDAWYEAWKQPKLNYMRKAYEGYLYAWSDPQCIVVRHEDICLNTRQTLEKLFHHTGASGSLSCLLFKNKRYDNTRGHSISPASCLSHRDIIPQGLEEKIVQDFAEFTRWFYDFTL
jgi:hypothetical protein